MRQTKNVYKPGGYALPYRTTVIGCDYSYPRSRNCIAACTHYKDLFHGAIAKIMIYKSKMSNDGIQALYRECKYITLT
jgi:hypothetical protein